MTTSEFSIKSAWHADHRGPWRWVFSHAMRHMWFIVLMFVGAAGNAWLASTQPILTGRAFDAVLNIPSALKELANVAFLLGVIQVIRGLGLQLLRNICAETLGQRLERDIRDELY
ncbi:MAG: ABC transporter ATP-binding protein, partial [Anaerolineae bacterium]|nr:ABC transporter ATP-binding protein [Anaerolineae bacterium]